MAIQNVQSLSPNTRLPKWANGLIVVGSFIIVGTVAYYLYKRIKKKEDEKTSKDTVNEVEKEIKTIQQQGGVNATPSFTASTYQAAANTVAIMLDGCELPSTELKVIETIAKVIIKPIDWLTLVKVFGVRKIDNCGFGTGDTTYDLPTLLKDQLDSFSIYAMDINGYKKSGTVSNTIKILQDYLSAKGITL